MAAQLMERTGMSNCPGSGIESGEDFCSECGQSLNLSRYSNVRTGGRTPEPWLLAIVGLCLAVLFGVRAWQVGDALVGLDRQIEGDRAATLGGAFGTLSNREMLQAETVSPLLTERVPLRRSLDRAVTGLVLGLLAIATGVGAAFRSRWEPTEHRGRGPAGRELPPSSRSSPVRIAVRLWAFGEGLAASLLRALLIAVGASTGVQVVRGVPVTLELVDQALTRTVEVITIIGGMLS